MNDLMRLVASSRPARLDENDDTRPDPALIMAHPQRPTARPRSRRRLVLAGALPVVALAIAGAVVIGVGARPAKAPIATPSVTGAPATAVTGVPATARGVLLVAAEQSTHGATSGRYWRTEVEQGVRAQGGAIERRGTIERWLPTGRDATEVVVITSAGGPRGVKTAPAGTGLRLGGSEITARQLAALPADPAALRSRLLARLDTEAEGPADYLLFVAGQQLVGDLPVSPAVRAATYRMLADLPGVRLLGAVKDQRGRPGVAVGFLRNGSESRLIVDANDGRALAEESWHGGTLLSYQAILSAGYTDEVPPVR